MNYETLTMVIVGVFLYDIFIKPFIRTIYKAFSSAKWLDVKMVEIENKKDFIKGVIILAVALTFTVSGWLVYYYIVTKG
jgi:hypothetical protein